MTTYNPPRSPLEFYAPGTAPATAPEAPHGHESAPLETGSDPLPREEVPLSLSLSSDAVHFTVTAPSTVVPDSTFELNFWAHLEGQREEVIERAQRILSSSNLLLRSEGPFELPRGARLRIKISVPEFNIEPDHKPLLWVGEIATAAFIVYVPPGARYGSRRGRASVRLNGLQIATMDFLLFVGEPGDQGSYSVIHAPTLETHIHKTAFASYASEDRDQVLARVQGLEQHLKVFVDVVNLRSGQLWEQELWSVIKQSDVFYLFWCRHAKKSEWVEKEWRCALRHRGLEFIDPVPLEPFDKKNKELQPPEELAAKHFDDPILAFMKNTGHASDQPN